MIPPISIFKRYFLDYEQRNICSILVPRILQISEFIEAASRLLNSINDQCKNVHAIRNEVQRAITAHNTAVLDTALQQIEVLKGSIIEVECRV